MSEQLTSLKNKIEGARGDIYQMLLSDPTPELQLFLERGDNTLKGFLEDDFPLIEGAAE